ncbi:uncharacterized protein LOC108265824 isoform X1 [Ictalurus punctatus]|uniref:Uncharacterized protein LOC108265824 isoform X1 n=2 Tax=Ictalurus punctatus TaxID=7998 RepID=A0A2D0R1Z0_ICTPU|nr:uncharacterized protein LOC108265824 isoform X1 [Ictalurus punctatus]
MFYTSCTIILVFNFMKRAMCTIPILYVAFNLFVPTAADHALAEKGRAELQRLREFAGQTRYGACWSRALEKVHANCRDFSDDTQSMMALAFTHCHLRRSGRRFPECPDGADVKTCTRDMDPVAFNTYTEFFTHAHSICHYLQSEQWQHRAENTIHRLTESSAGVAEQLASTQRMAEDLVEAQSAALKSQETILRNGEELKTTLQHSTKGLRDVFAEMRHSVQEQQVAFAEIFKRVAFLQSFIMSESHTLSSLLYNALGFCASFLLTSTRRTSGARLFLFGLVALNVYLERLICRMVLEDDNPGYQQMERIAFLVGLLRKSMVMIACVVLLYFATRFRNVNRESLEILRELKETHTNLQQTLRKAERLSGALNGCTKPRQEQWGRKWDREEKSSMVILHPSGAIEATLPSISSLQRSRQCKSSVPPLEAPSTSEVPKRLQRRSSGSRVPNSSAVVYSVILEDSRNQPRYSLRSRKSLCALEPEGNRD